jgi:multicomponent Na+:H+ antiporter subunit E
MTPGRTIFAILNLALVYVLALASTHPLDVATGVLLGSVLAFGLRGRIALAPPGGRTPLLPRILWFPVFAWAVVADVVVGTWDVTLRVVSVRALRQPGIVRIPMGERTPQGVAVSALATTLSPGSLLVDIDWSRREMLVHMIDASDPDDIRERMQRFYDRYQRRVFP